MGYITPRPPLSARRLQEIEDQWYRKHSTRPKGSWLIEVIGVLYILALAIFVYLKT